VTIEKLPKRLPYEKGARKTLMKLTTDLAFMKEKLYCFIYDLFYLGASGFVQIKKLTLFLVF
jgi:hypothetical protein